MKNDSFNGPLFKIPLPIKKAPFVLDKPTDLNWPIFKVKNDP